LKTEECGLIEGPADYLIYAAHFLSDEDTIPLIGAVWGFSTRNDVTLNRSTYV
jgi:hypothetical protein